MGRPDCFGQAWIAAGFRQLAGAVNARRETMRVGFIKDRTTILQRSGLP